MTTYCNFSLALYGPRCGDWAVLAEADQELEDVSGLRSTAPRAASRPDRLRRPPPPPSVIMDSDQIVGEEQSLAEHLDWLAGVLAGHRAGIEHVLSRSGSALRLSLRVMTDEEGSLVILPPALLTLIGGLGAELTVKVEHYAEGLREHGGERAAGSAEMGDHAAAS